MHKTDRADFWLTRWTEGQIPFHRSAPHPYLEAFWHQLALSQGAQVFVPLCGKSLDMAWLLERGYAVVGIELSPIAVEAFFHEQKLQWQSKKCGSLTLYQAKEKPLRLYCGDFYELSPQEIGPTQAIYDRAALIAIAPERRQAYAQHLLAIANPRTEILLQTISYSCAEIIGPPYSVSPEDIAQLFRSRHPRTILRQEPFRERIPTQLTQKGVKQITSYAFRL